MQPATAGSVAAHSSPAGRKKMSVSELTLFSLLIGTLILIVIVMSDDDDEGRFS
jgi:hypothetical protein